MVQATAMPSQTVVRAVRHLKIPPSNAGPGIFPFEPVFNLLNPGEHLRKCNGAHLDGVISGIARRLDIDRQNIYRWLRRGLTDRQADVIAVMLGLHPSLIWGDWFEHAPSEEEIELARKRCPRVVPSTPVEHRLAQLRLEGKSFGQIARTMTAEGWRTRAGNRIWSTGTAHNTFRSIKRVEAAA